MPQPLVLLSVPHLREDDVATMSQLRKMTAGGELAELVPSFPCVTCPVQANMTTGLRPVEHGVVANGFFWRERGQVEMWTAGNEAIERPQLWQTLGEAGLTSAVWFPLHAKRARAHSICTPAPIHNPDGTESLWCYTQPAELYGTLRDRLGHFPLQHFWGPLANIRATQWIAESAVVAAGQWKPDFFYIYLPHLDYAAQREGPESPAARAALAELDGVLVGLADGFAAAYGEPPVWLFAGEYAIAPVDHVVYPNRVLREAGLLAVRVTEQGEELDLAASRAWALVDHQFAHVFTADAETTRRVAEVFRGQEGIEDVLVGDALHAAGLGHARSGEAVLVSSPTSWQAYYWWLDDAQAPRYARTVDIHRKPGYDPVELCLDPVNHSIPLDATLIRGSHGAPARQANQRSVVVSSEPLMFPDRRLADTDVHGIVLRHFGLA